MILGVFGKLVAIRDFEKYLELEVSTQGGIRYGVMSPISVSAKVGDDIDLYTSYVVKEDSQSLYGFVNREHKRLFEELITVQGVGPKTAISIMSYYTYEDLIRIIVDADEKSLTKVSGLGAKSAKRIIIDLQVKLSKIALDISSDNTKSHKNIVGSTKSKDKLEELSNALSVLGFRNQELKKLLDKAEAICKEKDDISVENLLTDVLKR